MRHLSLLHSLLLTSIAFSALDASAGLPNFKSRTIESKNRQFVLVLLAPKAERQPRADFVKNIDGAYENYTGDERQEQIEDYEKEMAIEEKFSVSGLYTNDGSTEPLWKVTYISLCQEVYVANDGIHLVVMYSPWDSTCSGVRQLSFGTSGNKTFSYGHEWEYLPLVSLRLLMRACLGIPMPVDDSSHISDDLTEFIVITNQGDRLVFSLATGARLKRSSPRLYFTIIPLAVVPLGIWLWFRRQSKKQRHRLKPQRRCFQYSLKSLLGFVVFLCCSLAAVKLFGWFGIACLLIAMLGAVTAGFRSPFVGAWIVGAIAALYGAYVAVLFFAVLDDQLLNVFEISPLWWYNGWWQLCIPLSMIVAFGSAGVLFARRMFSGKSPSLLECQSE